MVDATTALTTASVESQAAKDKTTLAGDLDSFLILLTTQLKNQDPLSPLEPTEFTGQLVQFASVEQQISTNKSMEDLLAVQNASLAASVVGFIGTDVRATSTELPLQNGKAEFQYTLANNARATVLQILDTKGNAVLTKPGETASGSHTFNWDGKDSGGNQLQDGAYTYTVTPIDGYDQPVRVSTTIKANVTGVNMESGTTMLEAGGVSIPLENILAIKQVTSTE